MSANWFQKLVLGAAGLTALGIGLFILVAPRVFYATYGVELGDDASLMSELRAPAANLVALGAFVFAGAVRSQLARLSASLGSTIFLAYAFGRVVSLVLDGAPHEGLIEALIIEAAIGALCLLALRSSPVAAARSSAMAA